MSGSATWVGIRKGGMPGEVFPTADHPPKYILMGGEAGGDRGAERHDGK